MKAPVAYMAGIGAAAVAATVILFAVFSAIEGVAVFDIGEVFALLAANVVVAVIVGAPIITVLHKSNSIRWRRLSAAWCVVSGLAVGSCLALTPDDDLLLGGATPVDILVFSAAAGALGWICGTACWFTIDNLLRTNSSLE